MHLRSSLFALALVGGAAASAPPTDCDAGPQSRPKKSRGWTVPQSLPSYAYPLPKGFEYGGPSAGPDMVKAIFQADLQEWADWVDG